MPCGKESDRHHRKTGRCRAVDRRVISFSPASKPRDLRQGVIVHGVKGRSCSNDMVMLATIIYTPSVIELEPTTSCPDSNLPFPHMHAHRSPVILLTRTNNIHAQSVHDVFHLKQILATRLLIQGVRPFHLNTSLRIPRNVACRLMAKSLA